MNNNPTTIEQEVESRIAAFTKGCKFPSEQLAWLRELLIFGCTVTSDTPQTSHEAFEKWWNAHTIAQALGGFPMPIKDRTRLGWFAGVCFVFSVIRGSKQQGLTDEGRWIPPIHGDLPCEEYDPSGDGAGLEGDGFSQCAGCGYPKVLHGLLNLRTKLISYLAEGSTDGRPIRMQMRQELKDMVLPRPKPLLAQPTEEE